MKKKNMIIIFVCMMLIAVSISSVTGTNDENETLNKKSDDYNNLIKQDIESGIISKNDWLEQEKLLALDGGEDDWFGWSVSINNEYAIVGAPNDDQNGEDSGAAYIFKLEDTFWIEGQKLVGSDGTEGAHFGYSVSIYGGYAIIGVPDDNDYGNYSGSAYIFKNDGDTWIEEQKLLASDGVAGDVFGFSVSIKGDYLIIGSHGNDDNGGNSGAAYIFKNNGNTWVEEQKLLASDGEPGDIFGLSVSIDDDFVIIGAGGDDDYGNYSGSAFIFYNDGTAWIEQDKIIASDGAEQDYFGGSVSISGDYVIIGARLDDDNGDNSGSAYIFKHYYSTWVQQTKLLPSDGEEDDRFGYSVSLYRGYAIIGSNYDDNENGVYSGSAYIFNKDDTSWIESQKLLASDGAMGDHFGCSVSIDGYYATIGARGDDDNGEYSGSAYVFKKPIPDLDCTDDGTLSWSDVRPGVNLDGFITVDNFGGEPDSLLDWEIISCPDWGDWNFYPFSGTDVEAFSGIVIDVWVRTGWLYPDTEYTGEIVLVNSNDPDDTCIIDVSLATPVNQFQSNQQIPSFLQSIIERYLIMRQVLGL